MCFVVNKFLHLFQVLRNFQNTATAINAPPSPLQLDLLKGSQEVFIGKKVVHIHLKHFIYKDSI